MMNHKKTIAATVLMAAMMATIITLAFTVFSFRSESTVLRAQMRQTEADLGKERTTHIQTRADLSAATEGLQGAHGQILGLETNIDGLEAERIDLLSVNASLTAEREALNAVNAGLLSARAVLESERNGLRVELIERQSENDGLAATNTALEDERDTLVWAVETLGDERDTLVWAVETLGDESRDLSVSVEKLESDNAKLSAEGDRLVTVVERVSLDRAELRLTNTELGDTNTDLEASVASLEEKLQQLRDAAGTAQDLEGQAEELRAEIATLEQQRRPLVMNTVETFPTCTGSMEPFIKCTDSLVHLRNFRVEDITVGTVISFLPPGSDEGDHHILHRVMDIKTEDGVRYFWPKGDAAHEPDGYWVPEGNIWGYAIKIIEGTRLENADLRQRVNDVNMAFHDHRDAWKAALEHYDEVALRYCGKTRPAVCSTSKGNYAKVKRAHNKYKAAYDNYIRASCHRGEVIHEARHYSYSPERDWRWGPPPPPAIYITPFACFSL